VTDAPAYRIWPLPAPDVIAREIVEDLTAALAEVEAVAAALETSVRGLAD
jgi:type I restriction enzyme M protein